EEDLANIAQELEFAVGPEDAVPENRPRRPSQVLPETDDSTEYAEQFLNQRPESSAPKKASFTVILFDFQSDFFQKAKTQFPKGFDYQIATNLNDLNKHLASKNFQICVFNYDVNPKAVNQLTAQIKQKFPATKTMIMAKAISPEKAKIHARTPSGAHGYYQFPLDEKKIQAEFLKIHSNVKKVS
ncbi:MAG: hypothetical protein ACLGHN_15520, partial [Bacteriovoracia bacterium]